MGERRGREGGVLLAGLQEGVGGADDEG
ncbi:hypothetical protein STRTUCAR8_08120, partial [Streptomyces turgidiscabies Car8]